MLHFVYQLLVGVLFGAGAGRVTVSSSMLFFFSLLKTAAGCSWKQSGWGSESEPNRKEVENQNKSKDAIKLQLRDTSLWVCHLKWPLHTSPPAAEPQKRSSEWRWCWTFFWASRWVSVFWPFLLKTAACYMTQNANLWTVYPKQLAWRESL